MKNMPIALVGLSLLACSDNHGSPDASVDAAPSHAVAQTNLFADTAAGGAQHVDPNLVNAWGLAINPTANVAWVSDNGTGVLSLYGANASAPESLVVTVPPPAGAQGPATPTGQVFNGGTDFMGDHFIVSTEDGTIAGWQSGTAATLRVDNSGTGAIYKGLTIVPTSPPFILAANFHAGTVDGFDASYAPDAPAKWVDPSVPAGFAPFNVAAIGDKVYVAYTMQDADKHDDVSGQGHGAVSVFDQNGALVKSLVAAGGVLDSPWALVMIGGGGFGGFPSGTLLVGNFGDGTVHAFDAATGALLGSLTSGSAPLVIGGLWGLAFSPTGDRLYFTAGPNDEKNGLFGYLTP